MNPAQHNLLAQMQINSLEIGRRKALLEFGTQNEALLAALLAACRAVMAGEVDALMAAFYARQIAVVGVAHIIGDRDSLARLSVAMKHYVIDLFSGYYDEEYVNGRLRIGLMHKRTGVAPKYYLSAMYLLRQLLMATLVRVLPDRAVCEATQQALDKLLYLDNEFVFDTYSRSLLLELESAKDQAVQHAHDLEKMVALRTRELERLSRRDALTGLSNRRHFMEALRQELLHAKRGGHMLALLYLDLDGFKAVNDSDGHLAGDQVLKLVAAALDRVCRISDLSCRFGGDEFCVLLPDTDLQGALDFGQRLIAVLSHLPSAVSLQHRRGNGRGG